MDVPSGVLRFILLALARVDVFPPSKPPFAVKTPALKSLHQWPNRNITVQANCFALASRRWCDRSCSWVSDGVSKIIHSFAEKVNTSTTAPCRSEKLIAASNGPAR